MSSKEEYIVYTVVNGYAYCICYTEEKGFFVATDPPYKETAIWDKETAENVAKKNSVNGVIYKTKNINI